MANRHVSQKQAGGKGNDYSGKNKVDTAAKSKKDGFASGGAVKLAGKPNGMKATKNLCRARGGRAGSPFSAAHIKTNGDA